MSVRKYVEEELFLPTIKRHLKKFLLNFTLVMLHPLLLLLRRVSSGNEAYSLFSKYGYHLLRKHYYLPIPEAEDLKYQRDTKLAGIEIDEKICFDLLERVILKYKPEFNRCPHHKTDDRTEYYVVNGNFMAIDGNLYYSLIRHLRPNKIVEIGSGNSTLLAIQAINKNIQETDKVPQLICIEPHPSEILRTTLPNYVELKVQKVQEAALALFESLGPGDILFIDSTHVLKSGGGVWWEYCEILPRLHPGVYVHLHDISLPKPYPKVYFDTHLYFNEQYLLQAFLALNSKFEILWPGNYLMCKHPKRMQEAFSPEYDLMRESYPFSEPTSFWIRVKE